MPSSSARSRYSRRYARSASARRPVWLSAVIRLFLTSLRETAAQHVRRVRTEAAAQLLVSTPLPLNAVARRCGFGSTESLRQALLDRYDMPPSRYRRQAAHQHRYPEGRARRTA
jgi:transcriptional regulator GlxA family with amidase domain